MKIKSEKFNIEKTIATKEQRCFFCGFLYILISN